MAGILVDTSVWIEHFRKTNSILQKLLIDGEVLCHEFVIGELACGNLKNRTEILSLLQKLPQSKIASNAETLGLIENKRLMGKGIGWIDAHLLTSALLTQAKLWTADKRLEKVSIELSVGFK
jgi:predicted nucleic acid-binding protein